MEEECACKCVSVQHTYKFEILQNLRQLKLITNDMNAITWIKLMFNGGSRRFDHAYRIVKKETPDTEFRIFPDYDRIPLGDDKLTIEVITCRSVHLSIVGVPVDVIQQPPVFVQVPNYFARCICDHPSKYIDVFLRRNRQTIEKYKPKHIDVVFVAVDKNFVEIPNAVIMDSDPCNVYERSDWCGTITFSVRVRFTLDESLAERVHSVIAYYYDEVTV